MCVEGTWRKSSRSSDTANRVEVAWHKNSRSGDDANCVEVAWRKSSRSSDQANCVEVAFAGPAVAVRDSKNQGGPVLAFPEGGWRTFLAGR